MCSPVNSTFSIRMPTAFVGRSSEFRRIFCGTYAVCLAAFRDFQKERMCHATSNESNSFFKKYMSSEVVVRITDAATEAVYSHYRDEDGTLQDESGSICRIVKRSFILNFDNAILRSSSEAVFRIMWDEFHPKWGVIYDQLKGSEDVAKYKSDKVANATELVKARRREFTYLIMFGLLHEFPMSVRLQVLHFTFDSTFDLW